MTYTKLLNKLIDDSGLSNKEILEQCESYGMKITPNYLSVLKNNESKVASDELSRVLAKICGAENEELLVVQAYLDKAPQIIVDCLSLIFETGKEAMESAFKENKNKLPEELYSFLYEQSKAKIENLTLAEFICNYPTMAEMAKEFDIEKERNAENIINIKGKKSKWALIKIESDDDVKIIG